MENFETGAVTNLNSETTKFPVVAIGGSAGGLEAMTEIMGNLPNNTGMAYVYIQHLNRNLDSSLVEIFQRVTKIPVLEVQEGTTLVPDHLFIIPPNADMRFDGKIFKLSARADSTVRHSPIDAFFVSLAHNKREGSIGIILSGTNSDGAAGLKAIKQGGGITYAQDDSALFQSMPKSAIAEGFIDAVLSPHEIAQELSRLSKRSALLLSLSSVEPDDDGDEDEYFKQLEGVKPEDVKKILRAVKNITGVDFAHYKQNTIRRRIIRRMLLHKLDTLAEYCDLLKKDPGEVYLLYRDLLINVTCFFRDPDATEYLQKELLPMLLKNKNAHHPLRIWVPACSTGEEAYSIAMMVCEILGGNPPPKMIQIFATDLSEIAIAKARVGIFARTDVISLSHERLEKFCTRIDGHYRINKSIRDLCIFAPHNVLKDPPFSRVDIISCCNLLIYFDTMLQQKVLTNFHYALNKKGYLVLGKAETVGTLVNLFSPLSKNFRIFSKKPEATSKVMFDVNLQSVVAAEPLEESILPNVKPPNDIGQVESLDKVVDNILLAQYVPAAVVVNYDLDILHFRGSTGLFLEPTPGKASLNLLKMIKPDLELELRTAAHKAIKTGDAVKVTGLNIAQKAGIYHISFEITPLLEQAKEKLLLIVFEEVKTPSSADLKVSFSKDRRVKQLEAELVALRTDMRSLIEAQEAANEELQSANEEILTSNEELQSINEELETSKEELESSNEELLIINQELHVRNDQLGEAHEYTTKVIETIREAVIILDDHLIVKTANKAFYRIFHAKNENTDGKIIFEIENGQWNIPQLRELLEVILRDQNQYYEYELNHHFRDLGEKVLLLSAKRIVQKTNHQKIILLAIEDITEYRKAKKLLEEREAWLRNMADSVPVIIWVAGLDRGFTFVNKTLLAFTGRAIEAEIGTGWTEGIHKDDLDIVLKTYHSSFDRREPFNIECRMRRFDGEYRWVMKSGVPSYDTNGVFTGYTGSCTEIHNKKLVHEELEKRVKERTADLQEANLNLERSNSDLAQFAYVASHDLQEPLRKIITFSTRLEERMTDLVLPQGKEYIKKINSSAERMRTLIDDLLNFSRLSRRNKKFVQTDLNKVFREVLSDFELLIQEKKAAISVQHKLPTLAAIPLQMNQLFTNLLGNALKFTLQGSVPVISVECRKLSADDIQDFSKLDKATNYFEITFRDNGIGFPQEFADQIFVIFQRLNEKQDYPGTGIGLALCRKIVRNHGGEIFARSEEGKGSAFYVILPAGQVAKHYNEKDNNEEDIED